MKSSTPGAVKLVSMSFYRPTRSIRLLQTKHTEDRFRDKRRSSHATN